MERTEAYGRTHLEVYDALLRLQAAISQPIEMPIFRGPRWANVTSILDFGCGNGEYISHIARAFPHIQCTGVDTNGEFVAMAKERHSLRNLDFKEGSLDNLDDEFSCDMLLSRLTLMYLPDRSIVPQWAKKHVRIGAVLIDADDDIFHVSPPIPLFLEAIAKIQKRADFLGGKRNLKDETQALWSDAGFELASQTTVAVHSELPGGRELMHHLMVLNAELAVGTPLDPALLEEIFAWSLDRMSFLQYGLSVHEFVRA